MPRRAALSHSLWAAPGPASLYGEDLTSLRCCGNAEVKSGSRCTATPGQEAAKHLGSKAPSGARQPESSDGSAREGVLAVEAKRFETGYRDACDHLLSTFAAGIVKSAAALEMSVVQQEAGRRDVRNQYGSWRRLLSQPCRSR